MVNKVWLVYNQEECPEAIFDSEEAAEIFREFLDKERRARNLYYAPVVNEEFVHSLEDLNDLQSSRG